MENETNEEIELHFIFRKEMSIILLDGSNLKIKKTFYITWIWMKASSFIFLETNEKTENWTFFLKPHSYNK